MTPVGSVSGQYWIRRQRVLERVLLAILRGGLMVVIPTVYGLAGLGDGDRLRAALVTGRCAWWFAVFSTHVRVIISTLLSMPSR